MDRQIIYPGSVPLDSDLLNVQRKTMVALGMLTKAAFGTGTLVDGLALNATSPASLTVTVGQGSIIALETVDPNAFGSLAADNTDALVKMGINLGSTSFTLTAPTTSGQSINYLIEATFEETDTTPVTLPYYNAANPSVPYSGPSNSGTAQNTQRLQVVELQLKAGAAANTGTQTTPAVDSGWSPLYVITVNYGQTQITSSYLGTNGANVVAPLAPFIAAKIPQIRTKLTANLNLYVATTGNDSTGNGSSIAPFATLQKAWNALVENYDLNNYGATINIGAGTFTGGVSCQFTPPGYGSSSFLTFAGQGSSTIISATSSCCFYVSSSTVYINNLYVTSSGTATDYQGIGYGIYAQFGAVIIISGVTFGPCGMGHMTSTTGSYISASGSPYTISGGALWHWRGGTLGDITCADSTVTITGTPNFSVAFAITDAFGNLAVWNITFVGSATGSRYANNQLGNISTQGAGPNYFPGNSAGTGTGEYY